MITYVLIGFTALVSVPAFNNSRWFGRLQFNAWQIYHRREIYRMVTHGFLHANWMHLIVNMLVLFFFGPHVEETLQRILPLGAERFSGLIYMLFYFSAIVVASSISLIRHRQDIWYNAVGASGAVSSVVFFFIFFNPWELIYFYGILPVPGIIMGVLYLVYSHYMSRRATDHINHDAHLVGALFGFAFPILIDAQLLQEFLTRLLGAN